jgi:hypothetical protein
MLDTLKQKLLSWTPTKANEFFNNISRSAPGTSRIWELAPTGYFLYDSMYSAYFDYNGKSYTLSVTDTTEDYARKQLLSNAAVENGFIAIEKPLSFESLDIWGVTYTYAEEVRPYGSLGISLLNLVLTDNQEAVLQGCINDFFKIRQQLIELRDLTVLPVPNSYYNVFDPFKHLYYDPASGNYFLVGDFCNVFGAPPEEWTDEVFIQKLSNLFPNTKITIPTR